MDVADIIFEKSNQTEKKAIEQDPKSLPIRISSHWIHKILQNFLLPFSFWALRREK
jgi:hypothetical protein